MAVLLSLSMLVAPDLTVAPIGGQLSRAIDTRPPAPVTGVLGGGPPIGPGVGAVDAPLYPAALEAALAVSGADGASFAIVRDGVVLWTGAAGTAAEGQPMAAETPHVIGSVTKTFVAAATLALVDDGTLTLDATMGDLLPAYRAVPPQVTVRQLLEHRSGIADLFNPATTLAIETSPDWPWSPDQVLATVGDPVHLPEAGWTYSNTNYLLLAMIVERVGGQALADQLAARFLGPLGMADTRLLTIDDPAPLTAAWATIFWGSGAMTASATDLARWGDALYDGDLLTPETRARMLTFNADDYGLGAQRIGLRGHEGVGHTGLLDRYTTLLVHLPDANVTLALAVNRPRAALEAMLVAVPPSGGPSLLELATRR